MMHVYAVLLDSLLSSVPTAHKIGRNGNPVRIHVPAV
jgi:hypothetical protein